MVYIPIEDLATILFIFLNIALTGILISIYFKSYRAISSKITLGMLFFAAAFMLENLASLYFYSSLILQANLGLTLFMTSVKFLEMVGLIVLLYTTWK